MQKPTRTVIDRNSLAYKTPDEVDAMTQVAVIRKLMKDLKMPEFPRNATARVMRLRYRLAHLSILEQCEELHGSQRIDNQAECHKDSSEDTLRELCRSRGECTQGNIHRLRWRADRADLGIKKVAGEGYVLSPQRPGLDIEEEKVQWNREEYKELGGSTRKAQLGSTASIPHLTRADTTGNNNLLPTHASQHKASADFDPAKPQHTGGSAIAQVYQKTGPRATQPQHSTQGGFIPVPEEHLPSQPDHTAEDPQSGLTASLWVRVRETTFRLFWGLVRYLVTLTWGDGLMILRHLQAAFCVLNYLRTHRVAIGFFMLALLPLLGMMTERYPWLQPLYNAIVFVLGCLRRVVAFIQLHHKAWDLLTSRWPGLNQFGFDWWAELNRIVLRVVSVPDMSHCSERPQCPKWHCEIVKTGEGEAKCRLMAGTAAVDVLVRAAVLTCDALPGVPSAVLNVLSESHGATSAVSEVAGLA